MKTNFFPIHTTIIVNIPNKHILIDDYQQSSIQNYPYNRHSFTFHLYKNSLFYPYHIIILSIHHTIFKNSQNLHFLSKITYYTSAHFIHNIFHCFIPLLQHFISQNISKKVFYAKKTTFSSHLYQCFQNNNIFLYLLTII